MSVGEGYFGFFVCHVCLEFFFEVGFEFFEEFSGDGQMKAEVVVDALAFEVSFLGGGTLDFNHSHHSFPLSLKVTSQGILQVEQCFQQY